MVRIPTRSFETKDRVLSFFLALVFTLSCVVVGLPSFKLKAKAAESAKDSGTIEYDIGIFDYDVSLVETGNGSYKMTFNIASEVKQNAQNSVSTVATDGYFVADFTGQYLVELWGGNGAKGDNDFGDGGKGGTGGHVYGYVYLNKGDILYYDLGGAGLQSIAPNSDTAANGGGPHGEQGNKKVGGGGGYSAVYLFSANSSNHGASYFKDTYLDENGNFNLSDVSKEDWEYDRTHNFIMVAGGAGGGGAGRGLGGGVRNFFSGSDPTPDGGNGGNANGTPISVAGGVVFAGQDGVSTTKKDQGHVGKGGSDVPGPDNTTALGWWEGGKPNNWEGTYADGVPGGYGAKGNFRGGGGGAGYCGGSGGIQKSALIPEDIGGGGGGSSYIASTVNNQPVDYSSVSNDIKNRTNPNDATTGGGFVDINYMGEEDQGSSASNWLDSLYFSVNVSPYFTVDVESTSGTPGFNPDSMGGEAYVANFALSDGGTSTITLTFTPIEGFKGGNNVPLLYTDSHQPNPEFALIDTTGAVPWPDNIQTKTINDDVSYVNVPLNMTAQGETVEIPAEGESAGIINTADLYTDNYEMVRGSVNNDTTASLTTRVYDFIGNISNYYVHDPDDPDDEFVKPSGKPDKPITPGGAKAYTVGVTVEPKYSPAKVGKPVTTTEVTAIGYADTAEKVTINGIVYNTEKDISYDAATDTYTLTLKVSSNYDNDDLTFTQAKSVGESSRTITKSSSAEDKVYTVPADGWYLIQARGGNGAKGGDANVRNGKGSATGGAGGSGGYVYGWIYLERGTKLTATIGENGTPAGTDGVKPSSDGAAGTGGAGGKPSSILATKTDNTTFGVVVAGAGGGGGGAAATAPNTGVLRIHEDNGDPGSNAGTATTYSAAMTTPSAEDMHGKDGKTNTSGLAGWSATGGAGGQSSKSYSALLSQDVSDSSGLSEHAKAMYTQTTGISLTEPSVRITLLDQAISPMDDVRESLKNKLRGLAVVDYEFTQYFTDITMIAPTDEEYEACINIPGMATPNSDGVTESITASLNNLTWTWTFKPIDGFFGGNDIEALKKITLKQTDSNYEDGFKRFAGTTHETINDLEIMPQDRPGATDTGNVVPNAKYDFVNHKLASPIEASVVTDNLRVLYGTTVQFNQLFNVTRNDWDDAGLKDDYVNRIYENDFPDGGFEATENKTFTYTFGISPKNNTSKGIVDDIDKERYTSLHANVTVYSEVTTDLDHMEYFGPTEVDYGHNLTANVKAEAGYINPELTSVTSGGKTLVSGKDYNYDEEYGELTVYADSIKGEVKITAKAYVQPYHIYFIAYDENAQIIPELTNGKYEPNTGTLPQMEVNPGDDITGYIPVISPELRDQKPGYQFKWDFGTDDGSAITTMPAYDLWVYGTFMPYTYTLKINYLDVGADGKQGTSDDVVISDPLIKDKIAYGARYVFESPVVSGKELCNPEEAAYDFTVNESFLTEKGITYGISTFEETDNREINVNIYYKDKVPGNVLTLRYIADDTGEYLNSNTYVNFADCGSSYELVEGNLFSKVGYKIANIQYYNAGAEDHGDFHSLPYTIEGIDEYSDIVVDIFYVPETYTVTFNANGHGTAPAAIKDVTYGTKISAPEDPANPTGYTFGGWYTEAACTNAWNFSENTVTGDTELFAKWTANEYDVTFIYNNGVTDPTEGKVAYGSAYGAVLPVQPQKTGFAFADWWTDPTGGTKVTSATVYSPENPAAHTLYAHWTPLAYNVIFMKTVDEELASYQKDFATSISVPNAVREGYTLIGWASSDTTIAPDLAANATETTVPAGDITYTAQWEQNRNIVVTVIDVDKEAVADATVTLSGVGDLTTDGSGVATFVMPANGDYTVTATIAGRTASADVTKVNNVADTTVTVKLTDYDITKPVVASDYDDQWHKGSVTLNFTDSVPTYGTPTFQYKDGGNWVDVPAGGLVVTGEANTAETKTVEVRAISASGIVGDPTSIEVKIDNKAPVVTITIGDKSWSVLTTPVNFDNYLTSTDNVIATITFSDDHSGIDGKVAKYCVADAETAVDDLVWTDTADGTVTITAVNGKKFVVYAMVEDAAGNTRVISSDGFTFDLEDPTVTAELVDPDKIEATKKIAISNVADSVSGVAKIEVGEYNEASGDYTWTVPSNPAEYPIEENGTYVVRVTDGAGRTTTTPEIVVTTIDRTAPVLSLSATAGGEAYNSGDWTNKDVVITVSDTSETLGKTTFYYSTNGGTSWTKIDSAENKSASVTKDTDCEGLVYTFKAESESGVPSEETVAVTVNRDTVDPECTAVLEENSWSTFLNKIDVFNIFYKEAKTGTITPTDNASGVAETKFLVSDVSLTIEDLKALNESAWDHTVTTENNSFIIDDPDGNKILYVRVTDNAGNVKYISSNGMVFDKTAPVIDVTFNPFESGEWVSDDTVTIYVNVIDPASGIKTVTYSYSGDVHETVNATVGNDGTFTIPNSNIPNGEYTITVTATDNAGNTSSKDINVKRASDSSLVITDPEDVTVTYGAEKVTFSTTADSVSGVKSYEWQKSENGIDGWTAIDAAVNASAATATLEINRPTVVDNNGDYYRVVVTSNSDVVKTSDSAQLTVNKRELVISPKDQAYNFGTEESKASVFLANSKTGDEFDYLAFDEGKAPVFNDAVVFTGQFVRANPDVAVVGHYSITSDDSPRDVKLASGTQVNGNYTLSWSSETADFEIKDYVVDEKAILVGETNNDWYYLETDGDGVRVTAPDGYSIRRTADDSWAAYFTVEDGVYADGITYFLKNNATGAITSQMTTVAVSQDTAAPAGTITIDGHDWTEMVADVSLNNYKGENISAAVTSSDSGSGVSTVKYYVADSKKTVDTLPAADSEDWKAVSENSVTIPAVDKKTVVLYVMVEDVAGNVYFLSSNGFTFDLTPPTVTATLENPEKIEQTKTIKISDVADPESGITKLEVGVYNEATGNYDWSEIPANTTSYPIEVNGKYVVRATNGADATQTTTDPIVVTTVDRNLPVIVVNAKADSKDYTGDWTNKDVVITLTDTSDTLGKTTFYYSTDDGANWTAIASTENDSAVITVNQDCTGRVYKFKAISEAEKTANAATTVTVNRDTVAPTGTAVLESNNWSTFLDTIDVFNIFYKDPKTGTITAADTSGTANSGIDKVYYIVKSEPMTLEQLKALTVWNDATDGDKYSFIIDDPQGNKILYVLIKDEAGNATYISSAGMVYDHVPPEIHATPSFTEGEWTDLSEITITIDEIIDTVSKLDKGSVSYSYSDDAHATVNVPETSIADNGGFVIPDANIPIGDYTITITASDKAGNVGTKTIHVMRADDDALVVSNPSDVTITYGDTIAIDNGNGVEYVDAPAVFTVKAESVLGVNSYTWEKRESGSDTWVPVTDGTDRITIRNSDDMKSSTLEVASPTVVADNGDAYRVTVSSGTDTEKVSKAATLTVNPRQLTVTPKNQEYLYGTDESDDFVFPASETKYWEFYNNLPESKPINNDPVSFEGRFVRAEGIMPGTYIIASDTGTNKFRLADDSTGVNVNGNYYLRVEPTTSHFVINEYDSGAVATLEGEHNDDNWFRRGADGDGVRITAPTGYKISTTNTADGTWSDYLTVPDGKYNDGVNYYLRNVNTESADYHAISVMKTTAAFKQDTVDPSGKITIGENTWNKLLDVLEKITFGIFKNDSVTATIDSSDNEGGSGVGAVEYYIDKSGSDTPLTAEQLKNVSWTTGNAPEIAKADKDKFVVYARVTDNAGNIYLISSQGHVFDLTDPAIDAALVDAEKIEQAKTIKVNSVTDPESGITKVEVGTFNTATNEYDWTDITSQSLPYTINVNANGKYAVRATNGAGSVALKEIEVTTVDKTVPVLSLEAVSNDAAYTGDWTTKDVVITVTDNSGTLGKTTFYASTDGGANWDEVPSDKNKQASITVSDDCKDLVYTFKAVSAAGVDSESTVSATVNKDATKPAITATPNPAFSATEWTVDDDVTIAVKVTDATSGIADNSVSYSYSDDIHATVDVDASDIDAQGNFTIPNADIPNGEYDITIVVSDNAGNENATTVHVRRSDSSALTVNDPADVTVTYGAEKATFTVSADSVAGIKSYQWQKCESGLDADDEDNWTNYGEKVTTSAKTNKLDIATPSVIADNGDRYRVVVTSVSGQTETSNAAQLTVDKFKLVISPNSQSYYYGTTESTAYEFPANAKTDTGDYKYFTFADGKAPINNDAVEFDGMFERAHPESAEVGNYSISSASSPANVRLKSGVEVNGNYELTINPPTASFEIKAYTPGADATLVGTISNGWYKLETDGDGVRVTAPAGYEIRRTTADEWAPYFTVADGTYDTGVTYFLKEIATDAVTTEKTTASFKQDTAVPTGTVTTQRDAWSTFLEVISLGWYTNKDLNVNITSADGTGSGVATVQYYIANAAMTKDEVNAITDWSDYTQDLTIPKENEKKVVIYAKIADKAGNVTVISSNGHVFDLVNPTMTSGDTAVTPGSTVNTSGTRTIVVTDTVFTGTADEVNTIDTITAVDGKGNPVDAQHVSITDGTVFVSNDYDETYVITATDKAGNAVTYTIIIKSIPTFVDELDNKWADPSKPTEEELAAAINAIDALLAAEGSNLDVYNGDVDQYKGQNETDILATKRAELLAELKADEIARLNLEAADAIAHIRDNKEDKDLSDDDKALIADVETTLANAIAAINNTENDTPAEITPIVTNAENQFNADVAKDFVNEHASDNNYADTYDTATDPVDDKNVDRVLSGKDEYADYVANNPAVVDLIDNMYIAVADEAGDVPYANYPAMVTAAEAVVNNEKNEAKTDINDAAAAAIAAVKDNKPDEQLTDAEKDLIQDIIDKRDEALAAVDTADTVGKIEDIVNDAKDVFTDKIAEDFVRDHASANDPAAPYDKDGNPVTTDNANQIIAGETEYNGYSDEIKDKINDLINKDNDPVPDELYESYDDMLADAKKAVSDDVTNAKNDAKDAIDDAAAKAIEDIKDGKPDDQLTDEEKDLIKEIEEERDKAKDDIDKLTGDYPDILDDIQDIVDDTTDDFDDDVKKDEINDAADEAIEKIKDGKEDKDLTDEEKDLIDEINDARDDAINALDNPSVDTDDERDKIVDDAQKIFNEKMAEDFVNDHASPNDYTNPYDKHNDPADADNANQIISGEDEYNGYNADVQKLIDDLIKEKSEDSDEPYTGYPEMLQDAKNAISDDVTEAKQDAKDAIDAAAQDAIDKVKDGKPDNQLTDEEKDLIEDIKKERDEAKEDINNLTGDYPDILEDIQDRVDEAQDVFDDKVAEDFVRDHASDNNPANPYDKTNDPVDADNATRVVAGEDEWNNATDSVKDKINDLINKKSEDSDTPYSGYPEMLEAAEKAIEDDIADAKQDAKDAIDDAAEKAIEDIKDGKPDDQLTDEEKDLIKEIEEERDKAKDDIDKLTGDYPDILDDIQDIVDDTKDDFDDDVKKDKINDAADEAIEKIKDGKEDKDLTDEEKDLIDEINDARDDAINALDNPSVDTDDERDKIVDDAKDIFTDKIAEDFVNDHASPNDNTNPYDKVNDPADANNAQQIIDGEDEYNGYPQDIKDKIDELINKKSEDSDNPYDDYQEMLDAAKQAKEDAEAIADAKEDAKKAIDDAAKDAIDKVKDGKPDDQLTDEEKDLIKEIEEERDKAKDDIDKLTGDYPDILEDIQDIVDDTKDDFDDDVKKDEINDAADEAIEKIKDGKEDKDLTDEEKNLIDEINDARDDAINALDNPSVDTDDERDKIVNDAKDIFTDKIAEDFVNDHASPNDNTNPYDKVNDPADADNADQIISGEDEYNGYPQDIKDKIDELINKKSENSDDPYDDYQEMLDAAKQAKEDAEALEKAKDDAKDEINDAADKAIEDIKDGKPDSELTDEEKDLIDEIEKARDDALDAIDKADNIDDINDIVDSTEDTFDDKVAEDFVNDHASDNDATDPYDKANNPVDEDNAQRVVDGQDEWNNASDSVKEKIDELIKQKSEDSDEPYSGYEEMLYTAQKILNPDELTVPEVQEIMIKDGYIHVDIQVENLIDPDNKYADNIDEIIRILSKSIDQSDADVFNAGGSVEIVMIIREIESDPANDAAIKADGNTLVKHIEILITKTQIAEDGTTIASKDITKTAEPITFVVPLGDAEKEGRVFYVYADHGGRAPAEKSPDGDGVRVTATVAFTNDKFSVFSIAYTEDEKVVDTSDPTPILSTIMLMYSSFGAAVLTGRKRREEEEMY